MAETLPGGVVPGRSSARSRGHPTAQDVTREPGRLREEGGGAKPTHGTATHVPGSQTYEFAAPTRQALALASIRAG